MEKMRKNNRNYFDRQVEWVLERLPRKVLHILREVPLHVEDQPSKRLMQELNVDDPEELCGYFTGVPFSGVSVFGRDVYLSADVSLPNSVTIFRRGIVTASRDEQGKVSRNNLRREIRITILHELAHLHGMDEEEIAEMGYG
jgi:predicted Zn-dependent protease with MMP-like domain